MATRDLLQVLRLERALFPADAWLENTFREELRQSGRYYLVVETMPPVESLSPADTTRIVGYAGLRAVPPEGDIQTVAVSAAHWGRGVGTALVAELLDEAQRRGVTELFLEVRADNPRAQELYRRFGFTEIGQRRGYYSDGVDAVVMRWKSAG